MLAIAVTIEAVRLVGKVTRIPSSSAAVSIGTLLHLSQPVLGSQHVGPVSSWPIVGKDAVLRNEVEDPME
jgi:hypothetical protein